MLENNVVCCALFGLSVVLLSGLFFQRKVLINALIKIFKYDDDDEVSEVIWTNELSLNCNGDHEISIGQFGHNGHLKKDEMSPCHQQRSEDKLPTKLCTNKFCLEYNIRRLLSFIENAEHSIDLAMYTFTSLQISSAFQKAFKRGVNIRIISDKEMMHSTGSQVVALTKIGVPFRCSFSEAIMHHKFCIIDGRSRVNSIFKKKERKMKNINIKSRLLSGSLNWTHQGFRTNWENILCTSNEKHINLYEKEFERMWQANSVK